MAIKHTLFVLTILSSLLFKGCAQDLSCQNVLDELRREGRFQTFLNLLEHADLANRLQDGGKYTLLVPSDAALTHLPKEIANNPTKLRTLLLNHLVCGQISPQQLQLRTALTTEGSRVALTVHHQRTFIDDAVVEGRPVKTAHGVVIPIDRVLSTHSTGE